MDAKTLRRACEVAGLRKGDISWAHDWKEDGEDCVWSWYEDDPALPAYVASLLVAKVRERDIDARWLYGQVMSSEFDDVYMPTDEQRIAAALDVLT